MLASIPSATFLGASGYPVTVEVHVGGGLPGYHIVGMPDPACRESRDRVRAAVLSSGLRVADATAITVNLAPAGRRKTGAGLDLAIAVGVLVADGAAPAGVGRRARVHRRARPRRLAAPCSGRCPDGRRARRRRRRRAGELERRGPRCGQGRGAGRTTLGEVLAALTGETPWPTDPGPAAGLDDAAAARPRRRRAASRSPVGRWRSPPPAATTSCSSARPAPARRCSPSG